MINQADNQFRINGSEKPRLNENGGARMRVACEAGNPNDYEPPPDLNPAELGEENEKEKRLTRFATLSKSEKRF